TLRTARGYSACSMVACGATPSRETTMVMFGRYGDSPGHQEMPQQNHVDALALLA
ncbi:MAG: hypothetical protein UV36_C0036G0005, partial [Parcubacteria group bacterium GW2011_GWC2_42_6]